MKVRSPIKIHGGKSYLATRLIELMPEHTHYLEPFFGGGSVLFAKDPEGISETVNDLNGQLTNFWTVVRSKSMFPEFSRYVGCTPLSESDFIRAKLITNGSMCGSLTPVDQATAFFVRARQSRQGLGKDYATPTRRTRRGMNENVSAWLTAIDGLPEVHERLQRVEIRNMTAVDFITKYDHENALCYADPPYLHETRTTKSEYGDFEMTKADHIELLQCLANIKGNFLLSGYDNTIYEEWRAANDFRRADFEIDNKASSKKSKDKKIESVWMNY